MHQGSPESVISLGAWGGSGGCPWSYKTAHGINEITINVGDNIKSISFRDASGVISGTFGGRNPNPNGWGAEKKIPIRWPSEYLMSIRGTYGKYWGQVVIKSLSFISNLTTYGPFGATNDSDKAFSIPIADSVVVGFHGRAGFDLDALGIHVRPKEPKGSISLGSWGGSGGEHPFSFKVDGYIKQIIVYQGDNIKSIAFKDAKDHQYGTFGGLNPNDIGERKEIEIDGQSQRLTCISGTYGNVAGMTVITSLSFVINGTTHGPFGTKSGTSFSIPIQGSHVIGFHGRSGHYLDSIGIFVKPGPRNA